MAGLTPRTQAQEFYSDFSKNLDQIPGRKDLSRLLNENSIKESIKNIVLTNKGERLFQPNFGCDINASLFENIDNNTVLILRDNIKRAIRTFEPRCDLKNVEIIADLEATVVFSVINTSNTTSLTLDLVRER